MPIYEYQCSEHGVFEVWQGIREPALTRCQTKGCRRKVARLISAPAGAVIDPDKLYDMLPPRFPGDKREAKTDLPRNRAKLIGIPREERGKYERLYY